MNVQVERRHQPSQQSLLTVRIRESSVHGINVHKLDRPICVIGIIIFRYTHTQPMT